MLQNKLQWAIQPPTIMIFPAQNVSSAEVEKSKRGIINGFSVLPNLYHLLLSLLPWSCPPELCSVPTSSPNMGPCPISLNLLMLFSSVQSLSHVRHLATPWTAALQAFLSITNSWSLLKLMSIKWVMPSNHLILCHPLLLLSSIFPILGSFPMSWLFTTGSQSIGVWVSTSVLPMNI